LERGFAGRHSIVDHPLGNDPALPAAIGDETHQAVHDGNDGYLLNRDGRHDLFLAGNAVRTNNESVPDIRSLIFYQRLRAVSIKNP
jgi:hypothetical protein